MFTFATQFLHTDLRPVSTCSHISWLSTNRPFTQYSMRASGTGFSLMKIQYESNTGLTAACHV